MKTREIFLGTLYFELHMLCAAPLRFLLYFFHIFLYKYDRFFIGCSLMNSENLIIQALPLYASYLFSMLLNKGIADIEKPDGICSLTFFFNFQVYFYIHQSFLLYTLKIGINNECCFISFLILIKF